MFKAMSQVVEPPQAQQKPLKEKEPKKARESKPVKPRERSNSLSKLLGRKGKKPADQLQQTHLQQVVVLPSTLEHARLVSPSEYDILQVHATPTPRGLLDRAESDQTLNESMNKGSLKEVNEASSMKKKFSSETNLTQKPMEETGPLLDPNHPMLQKYQTLVQEQLIKQRDKLKAQLLEAETQRKVKEKEYEQVGVQLYTLREELNRSEQQASKRTEELDLVKNQRQEAEKKLEETKLLYKSLSEQLEQLRIKEKTLRTQISKTNLELEQARGQMKVTDDMKVVANAVKKAKHDLMGTEREKQEQDAVIMRLVNSIRDLEEELELWLGKIKATESELKQTQESLTETNIEVQTVNNEKRLLLDRWNETVQHMKRRDTVMANIQAALGALQQEMVRLDAEHSGLDRDVKKQQESVEKLSDTHRRQCSQVASAEQQLDQITVTIDSMETELKQLRKDLQEGQLQLKLASNEKSKTEHQLNLIKLRMTAERQELQQLEDELMERTEGTTRANKQGTIVQQQLRKLQVVTRQLDKECEDIREELVTTQQSDKEIEQQIQGLNKKKQEELKALSSLENEVRKAEQQLESLKIQKDKQTNFVQQLKRKMNSRLQQELKTTEASKIAPAEAELKSLQQALEAADKKIQAQRSEWLTEESTMIRLSDHQMRTEAEFDDIKQKVTLLEQKKMRLDAEIKDNENDIVIGKRLVTGLHTEIQRLNQLIAQRRGDESTLKESAINMEGNLVEKLKSSQLECLQLEEKLKTVRSECERIRYKVEDKITEAEKWEKKLNEAKASRSAIDGGQMQEELQQMRADVHRMQLRYTQLVKQQETLIKDMEKSVYKREVLLAKNDVTAKIGQKNFTKAAIQRQVADMERKIEQYTKDLEKGEEELQWAISERETAQRDLAKRNGDLQDLYGQQDNLNARKRETSAKKLKNIHTLIAAQHKEQFLQEAAEGKYVPLHTAASLEKHLQEEKDKRKKLEVIVKNMKDKFPDFKHVFLNIDLLLASN